jgi:hypothetical protein
LPELRHMLDHTEERLRDDHEAAATSMERFELPEADEKALDEVRRLVNRELETRL